MTPKSVMCKDCTVKYAQEMGLCRSCQTKRIGKPGDPGHSFQTLKTLAAEHGLVLMIERGPSRYVLAKGRERLCSTDVLSELPRLIEEAPRVR